MDDRGLGRGHPSLILASGSPRRRAILTELGLDFEVVTPEVEEVRAGDPETAVLENARRKARAGLERTRRGRSVEGEVWVVGCDTEVVIDGELLGKAADVGDARARLMLLAGRTHDVLGGLVLLIAARGEERERTGIARSAVTFRDLDQSTIELYVRSGEWRDRAGAYAVQGLGSMLVARVEGDVANVIGLPITLLAELAPELIERSPAGAGETVENPHSEV